MKMWKIILKKIGLWLVNVGVNFVFNTIDKNKDGSLSKNELNEFWNMIVDKFEKKGV